MSPDRLFELFALPWPRDPDTGEELDRALSFLDWESRPATVVRAGYGTGAAAGALTVLVAGTVEPVTTWLVPLVAASVGLVVVHAVHRIPVVAAALRRTRALGDAPGIVARAVLQMRIEPTVESAATFAARTGDGPLAASLARHVRRAAGEPRSGLGTFGDAWSEWFPELRRATSLVVAAADAGPGDRGHTLDRATEAVLSGTADRMGAFASEIRGPATALYAFGVLLPMALVALLPAAGVAGVPVSIPWIVLVYDLLLPGTVCVAGIWLLLRRPVAFPPRRLPGSHPARRAGRISGAVAGLSAGLVALVAGTVLLPGWIVPLLVVGVATGAGLVTAARPVVAVRRRVEAAEAKLPDALYLVGRRVAGGTSVESAIAQAARELPGPTGEVLAETAAVQERFRVGVEAAFLGDHGSLSDLPSTRFESAARLLASAAKEGKPAGKAVVASANHLSDLAEIERSARRDLAAVTGTLRHTGGVFGPMVAGATVRLAEGMAARGFGGTGPLATTVEGTVDGIAGVDPAGLGLAVGAYVLVLAVVLTGLSVGLERGLDPALVAYRAGGALLLASITFAASYVVAGLLV